MMHHAEMVLGAVATGMIVFVAYRLSRRRRCNHSSSAPLAFASCAVRSFQGYKLYVSLPLDYSTNEAKTRRYPMFLVLDAEPYLFPLMTIVARTNHFFARSFWHPDAIVIGIVADLEHSCLNEATGHLDVFKFWNSMRPTRARDYLPTSAESPWGYPGAPSLVGVAGQADDFAAWLVDCLLPMLDADYRTMGDEARALVGKSFGGSGVASCMIHQRCAAHFSEYVMCDPSISWDEGAWFRIEAERRAAFEEQRPPPTRGASAPHAAAVYCCESGAVARDAVFDARAMKAALDSRKVFAVVDQGIGGIADAVKGEVTIEKMPAETHGSASYPFAHRAMEFCKQRWERFEKA